MEDDAKIRRPALRKALVHTEASIGARPVALTLKVDDDTYFRLCVLRATQRRTCQDILRDALHEYLHRAEAKGQLAK